MTDASVHPCMGYRVDVDRLVADEVVDAVLVGVLGDDEVVDVTSGGSAWLERLWAMCAWRRTSPMAAQAPLNPRLCHLTLAPEHAHEHDRLRQRRAPRRRLREFSCA